MVVVSSGAVRPDLCIFPVTIFTELHDGKVAVQTQCSNSPLGAGVYCSTHHEARLKYNPAGLGTVNDPTTAAAVTKAVNVYHNRFKMPMSEFSPWARHLVKSRDEYIRRLIIGSSIDMVAGMEL